MKRLKDVELIFTLEKQFLDQASWEEGLKVMNKTGSWETFQKQVITANTLNELPVDLGPVLEIHAESHDRQPFNLVCDLCKYRVAALPLIEADGTEVGDIFILSKLDEALANQKIFMFFAFITTLIVLGFYLTLSRYMGKIESDLTGNRQQLEKEIMDHKKTEDKLAAHQAP